VFADWVGLYFELGGYAAILLATLLLLQQTRNFFQKILHSTQRVGRMGFVDFSMSTVTVGTQAALVAAGFSLAGLVYGVVAGTVVALLISAYLVYPVSVSRPERHHFERLGSFAKFSFVSNIQTKFYDNVDVLVIMYFLDASAVSLYNIPFRLSLALLVISTAISNVAFPEISRLASEGKSNGFGTYSRTLSSSASSSQFRRQSGPSSWRNQSL